MKIDDCLYMKKDFNPCVYCESMHLSLFRCPEIHSQHAKRKTDQTVDMHRLVCDFPVHKCRKVPFQVIPTEYRGYRRMDDLQFMSFSSVFQCHIRTMGG